MKTGKVKKISILLTTLFTLGLALLVLTGATQSDSNPDTSKRLYGGHTASVLSVSQLAGYSDLVVRATPLSTEFRQVPWHASNFDDRTPRGQLYRIAETIQFEVSEYLRGSGPETVAVHISRPGSVKTSGDEILASLQFNQGQEYVLFLVSAADIEGLWVNDGYMIQGSDQGRWVANGNTFARTDAFLPALNLSPEDLNAKLRDARPLAQ